MEHQRGAADPEQLFQHRHGHNTRPDPQHTLRPERCRHEDPALLCGRHGHRGQEHHQLDGQRVFQHSDDQPGSWHAHGAARGGAGADGRQHHQVKQHPLRRGRQGSREQHPVGVRKVRLFRRHRHRKRRHPLHPDKAVRQLHAPVRGLQPGGNPDTGGRVCREHAGLVRLRAVHGAEPDAARH